MNRKRWGALAIFLVLFISLALNPYACLGIGVEDEKWARKVYQPGTGDSLALIDLEGMIISAPDSPYLGDVDTQENFTDKMESAFASDDIEGIILRVNSPGGAVHKCDYIFNEIVNLKEKYEKPLLVYMDEVAASGAYLISATADKIMANRHALTGALGVYMTTINVHQLAEEWGIESETFQSGEYKDMLNPLREVKDEEREIMQEVIDESFSFLIDSILEQREMERDELKELADGRIYTGPQAEENELIDAVGTMDDAIEEAAVLADTSDPEVLHYYTEPPSTFEMLLNRINAGLSGPENLEEIIYQEYHHPRPMYLWKN